MQAPQARAPIIYLSLPARLAELLRIRDHRALSGAPALRGELGRVQLGFAPVCEPDNHSDRILSESVYGRAWHTALQAALGSELTATALVCRPHNLRGRRPIEVAERKTQPSPRVGHPY
jgi:hypothetical protein